LAYNIQLKCSAIQSIVANLRRLCCAIVIQPPDSLKKAV
jgi:hypothetical protein